MRELYVSVDIEADGPLPGPSSMLSLGAACFDLEGDEPRTPTATFETRLELLPDATPDEDTMAWWATQSEAWAAARREPLESPALAMERFACWLEALPGRPVFVGFPVTYDFMWAYWYLRRFAGRSPFGFQGLDLKTLAMRELGIPYRKATKRNLPKRWFEGAPKHTHEALQDAIGQGVMFVNMLGRG